MEANAIAEQVDQIAHSIADASNSNAVPTPGDRRKALETLVELRRLEQLKAIANGQGNSTYFFGERSMGIGELMKGDMYNADYAERLKKVAAEVTMKSKGGDVSL